MFFRQIEDFERVFKWMDRINILVFNVWRDKNAESFKDAEMKHLESFYRNYISEMREKSNEMIQLKESIQQQIAEINRDIIELDHLCDNPEINGCLLCRASGPLDEKNTIYGTEAFVARSSENIDMVAQQRCHKLMNVDSCTVERNC